MVVNYSCIFLIKNDIPAANLCNFQHLDNVDEYVHAIAEELQNNQAMRQYAFDDNYHTANDNVIYIVTKVNEILSVQENEQQRQEFYNQLAYFIESQPAHRLSCIEKEFNDTHQRLSLIPKGVLIVANVTSDDNKSRILMAKADYEEFMEQQSGAKKMGLPTKKKIYKAASFEYSSNEENHNYEINSIVICDTSNRDAKYWWKSFLELKELNSDECNTITAYKSIKTKVIAPLREQFKADYVGLYNLLLSYFSTNDAFYIDELQELFRNYVPYDEQLDKDKLIEKLRKLPERSHFDPVFNKVPEKVNDRMKRYSVPLAMNLELNIKGNVPDLNEIVTAGTDNQGRKYLRILSDEGYKFFNQE